MLALYWSLKWTQEFVELADSRSDGIIEESIVVLCGLGRKPTLWALGKFGSAHAVYIKNSEYALWDMMKDNVCEDQNWSYWISKPKPFISFSVVSDYIDDYYLFMAWFLCVGKLTFSILYYPQTIDKYLTTQCAMFKLIISHRKIIALIFCKILALFLSFDVIFDPNF